MSGYSPPPNGGNNSDNDQLILDAAEQYTDNSIDNLSTMVNSDLETPIDYYYNPNGSGAVSLDVSNYGVFHVRRTGNVTYSIANSAVLPTDQTFVMQLILEQDSVGGHTDTWPSNMLGIPTALSTAAGKVDTVTLRWIPSANAFVCTSYNIGAWSHSPTTVPATMSAPVASSPAALTVQLIGTVPDNGGAVIDQYDYNVYNSSTGALTTSGTVAAPAAGQTTVTVSTTTSIVAGQGYYGTMAAHNSAGLGAYSPESNTVYPSSNAAAEASAIDPVKGWAATGCRLGAARSTMNNGTVDRYGALVELEGEMTGRAPYTLNAKLYPGSGGLSKPWFQSGSDEYKAGLPVAGQQQRLVFADMMSGGVTWADIASGAHDSDIIARGHDLANYLVQFPGPVAPSFNHEPESNSPALGTGADFCAAWTHVMNTWITVADQTPGCNSAFIRPTIILSSSHFPGCGNYTGATPDARTFYSTTQVDPAPISGASTTITMSELCAIVLCDGYDRWGADGIPSQKKPQNIETLFINPDSTGKPTVNSFYDWASKTLPTTTAIGVGETGPANDPSMGPWRGDPNYPTQSQHDWAFEWAAFAAKWPLLKFLNWWSNNSTYNNLIDRNADSLAGWVAMGNQGIMQPLGMMGGCPCPVGWNGGNATSDSNGILTLNAVPTNTISGDYVIGTIAHNTTGITITPPDASWSQLGSEIHDAGNNIFVTLWYKKLTAPETATAYTFACKNGNAAASGVLGTGMFYAVRNILNGVSGAVIGSGGFTGSTAFVDPVQNAPNTCLQIVYVSGQVAAPQKLTPWGSPGAFNRPVSMSTSKPSGTNTGGTAAWRYVVNSGSIGGENITAAGGSPNLAGFSVLLSAS